MLTFPQTRTQTLKSSLNAKYPGWPAWEGLSAKTHYGGEWMIICTIQSSALQHWHLCKGIPTLSEFDFIPVFSHFLMQIKYAICHEELLCKKKRVLEDIIFHYVLLKTFVAQGNVVNPSLTVCSRCRYSLWAHLKRTLPVYDWFPPVSSLHVKQASC